MAQSMSITRNLRFFPNNGRSGVSSHTFLPHAMQQWSDE
jgi:hypothetical protein